MLGQSGPGRRNRDPLTWDGSLSKWEQLALSGAGGSYLPPTENENGVS